MKNAELVVGPIPTRLTTSQLLFKLQFIMASRIKNDTPAPGSA